MAPRKQRPKQPAHPQERRRTRSKQLASLAGGIAHDFNNLLTVVRTNVGFLQQELQDHPALPYVEQLEAATNRMAQVVRQLQAFSGGMLSAAVDLRPSEVIRRLSETLKHVLLETVDFRVAVRSNAVVSMDPSQFERAVVTLLLFVAESVPDGGHIWLTVADDESADSGSPDAKACVEIRIESSAPRVSARKSQRLFQPAFRKSRGSTGSDLRLASVAGIVDAAGGRIEPLGDQGRGLGFRIVLPCVEHVPGTAPKLELTRDRSLEGHEVILVVEDDPNVRRTVRESLERYGYSVLEAEDGTDALRLFDMLSAPPDLLLTDLVMPEVGGRELIDVLGKERKLSRVLLMSGYTDATLERAMPESVHPFIAKPFTDDELAVRVREVLDAT